MVRGGCVANDLRAYPLPSDQLRRREVYATAGGLAPCKFTRSFYRLGDRVAQRSSGVLPHRDDQRTRPCLVAICWRREGGARRGRRWPGRSIFRGVSMVAFNWVR